MMANFGNNPFGSNVFGTQNAQSASLFGNAAAPVSPFGQQTSLFGQGTGGSSQTGTGGFGSQTSNSLFGQQTLSQSTSAGSNTFGQASPAFGQGTSSGFGQSTSSGFGQTTGSAFGQTNNSSIGQATSSGFGQATNSGFGQTTGSGFGQSNSSILGQTSSSQPSNTSGFAQSTGFASGQTTNSGFGQLTGASFGQTTGSGFGQSTGSGLGQSTGSGFGQSTGSGFGQSTGSGFGQTTSSGFGQTTGSSFGQITSPGLGQPSSGIGQPTSPGFGQSSVSTPSLFARPPGVATSTSSPRNSFGGTSLFGKPNDTTSSVSQSTSTFFGQTTSATTASVASTGGVFGQVVSSTAASATQPSVSLFGQPLPAYSATSSSTTSGPGSLFQGKPQTATSPYGLYVGQSSAFKQSSSSSTASNAPGLFGRTTTTSDASPPSLFGKPLLASGSDASGFGVTSGGLFVKKEGQDSSVPTGLFGKASGAARPDNSGLFGKPVVKSEHVVVKKEPSSGAESRGLFGKGSVPSNQPSTAFGRPRIKKEEDDYEDPRVKQEPSSNPTRGLFGKSTDGVTSQTRPSQGADRKPDTMAARAATVTRGLFGTARQNEQSGPQGMFGRPGAPQRRTSSTAGDDNAEPRQLRRQISDDISNKVAIVCKNVASKYNTAHFLRKHFEKYGPVTKVYPNSSKMQATIHFKTHNAASEAKRRGRHFATGVVPMTIFWSNYQATTSPKPAGPSRSLPEVDQRPTRAQKRLSDTSMLPKSKRTPWQESDNTDDELASMSGTQDLKFDRDRSPPRPRLREMPLSPEKRGRTLSPGPSTSASDTKTEKLHVGMFQGVQAKSIADRLHLLKLRDQYIRQNRTKKNTDISTARAFTGTCPDMCPEKERYYREETRQLHYFELIPGTENNPGRNPQADHRRVVKEYLRSSPDQDEPLPYELRPGPVLHATMTYLLREIADRGQDGRWADWFDFLWNRTRGIRKDITQQQLCNRDAVDLIEKCARFHVFCSARLCEEDMHSFDAKINDENLTKCLQTLREFYYDLEKKQKCFCVNEAEFRAYTVLMNLNQGDILREVQQLRPEVRTSPEIRFAVQVYFSLNNNNYIKFFRLVKQASYGNACIMHRYFTQVRNRALVSMMKGYSMGMKAAQIPLSEVVRLLGFENENEASDFCEHYGFLIHDGEAMLDKAEYIEPETAWLPRRSVNLIESKLIVTVGEMINGGPFLKDESIIPRSSFDDNDRFYSAVELPSRGSEPSEPLVTVKKEVRIKQEPVTVKQEAEASTSEEVNQESVSTASHSLDIVPPKPIVPNEYIKDTAKMLFWEVIDEMTKSLSQETMSEVNLMRQVSSDYIECEILLGIKEDIQGLCQEVYDEERAMHHKAQLEERERQRDRVAVLLTDDIVTDLVHQEVLNLSTIQIREVKAQLKKESIERVTIDVNQQLIQDVVADMVAEVSIDVFDTDVTQRLKQLDEFEKIVKLSRAGRYLAMWKKEYTAVTKLKRGMQEFPSAMCMDNFEEQIKNLIHVDDNRVVDGQFYVNKRARLTVESAMEVDARRRKIGSQFTIHNLYQNLLQHTAWQPLDVTRVVGKQLIRNISHAELHLPSTLFWKLLLCLPDVSDDCSSLENVATRHLCDWLLAKFSKGGTPSEQQMDKSKVISLYKSKVAIDNVAVKRGNQLGICLRTVQGTLDSDDVNVVEDERQFLGASGLLFVLPAEPPMDQPDDIYWSKNQARLRRILEVRPTDQELPLVIIVPASANQSVSYDELSQYLSLDELIDDRQLCDAHVVVLEVEERYYQGINVVRPHVSEEICESLQWLAERTRPPPSLTVSYLKDCVETVLLEHFYTPVQQNLKKRRILRHLDQDPTSLLKLYNSVVQHIGIVLTADSLGTISWPVPEFIHSNSTVIPPCHWNSEDHFQYLYSLIRSLGLPEFRPLDPDSEEWCDVQRDLWQYVIAVAGSCFGPARVTFCSRVKKLLKQVEVDFEGTCYLQEGEENCQPSYINVPWSKLISICIDYRFDTTDFTDDFITSQESNLSELRVAYNDEELRNFTCPREWKHMESDKSILDTPSLDLTILKAVHKVKEKNSIIVKKPEISIVEDPNNISVLSVEANKSSNALLNSLKIERRRSDHFQKYLENALKGGESENTFTSPGEYVNGSMYDFENLNPEANDFSLAGNQRRLSFDATAYFGQTQNDLSRIFDQSDRRRLSDIGSRRLSDLGDSSRRQSDLGQDLQDLSKLSGKRRRERLSEVFGNDPVMMCLQQPSIPEDVQNLKDNIKASRRESDMFEKRLQSLLQNN